MLIFFLRKNLYDLWDNLYLAIICNIAFILIIASGATALFYINYTIVILAIIFLLSIWQSITNHLFVHIANFTALNSRHIKTALKNGFRYGVIYGLVQIVFALSIFFSFSACKILGGYLGLFILSLSFWFFLTIFLILQYTMLIIALNKHGIIDAYKKAIIIFIENPIAALGLAAYNVIVIIISALSVFIFPGPSANSLAGSIVVRMRLKKIDWLIETSKNKIKKCPWDLILQDDIQATGKRNIKDFLFPWR